MISSQKIITRVAAVVVTATAFAGLAHSQSTTSIPVPASSADSGSRAVVAITVPTTQDIQSIAVGAAPPVNQSGMCGFVGMSGFDRVAQSVPCQGHAIYTAPRTNWVGNSGGTFSCPAGHYLMQWGGDFSKRYHVGGSGGNGDNMYYYQKQYASCFKPA